MEVGLKAIDDALPQQAVHLTASAGRGPIHGLLNAGHCICRNLDIAVAGLAVLQRGDVIGVEIEAGQIRNFGRVAELSDSQKPGELAETVEVIGEPEIGFQSGIDAYRSKDEDFRRLAGL